MFGYTSEDYFLAKYEGLQIEQADIKIESPYIVDKYRKVIDGRFTIFQFEKDIWSDIVIVSKHCSKAVIEGMKKVGLEDMERNCADMKEVVDLIEILKLVKKDKMKE